MTRLFTLFLLTYAALAAPPPKGNGETALDRYVKAPDPNYKYEVVKTIPGQGYTGMVVETDIAGVAHGEGSESHSVEALAQHSEAG